MAATVTVVLAVCAAPQIAAAETVPLPSNALTGSSASAELWATSCPGSGDCVAVGNYAVGSGFQGLIEAEASGTWSAVEAPTTGLGASYVGLSDVSCPTVGNCVAVGSYDDTSNKTQALIETETSGVWTGSKLSLTSLGASGAELIFNSVSCSSAGNCSAVGAYSDSGGHEEGLIATESGGVWTASKANVSALGGSSTPAVQLNSVSCGGDGSCAAVGYFADTANHEQGLIETETAGTWTASKLNLLSLPSVAANPNVTLTSVSCPAAGDCTAVGRYVDGSLPDGSYQPVVLGSTNSVWSAPARATLPPATANFDDSSHTAQGNLALGSVSCSSPGNCTAVGSYDATSANVEEALELTEQGGTWATGLEESTPTAGLAEPYGQLNSVACFAAGACDAIGFYEPSTGGTDTWGLFQWSGPTSSSAVPALAGAAIDGSSAVSCSASGYCTAAGWAANASATTPFLLDAPAAVSAPSASASGTQAIVSWSPPADDGGMPITAYRVTANDLTNSSRGGQSTTSTGTTSSGETGTLTGLAPGDTYTFTVAATSAIGTGLSATSASVTVPPSAQQISASLAGLLAPKGAASRLKKLAKAHHYTFTYKPLESGKVSVRWYEATGKGKHRHRHLFASGSAATRGTAAVKVKVKLTAFGRAAVKAGHRLHLSATVTFVNGSTKVTRTHAFTLH